jgi:hypothetical protein
VLDVGPILAFHELHRLVVDRVQAELLALRPALGLRRRQKLDCALDVMS